MPNYRRAYIPGGTFFFTLKSERNAPIFRPRKTIRLLGSLFRKTKQKWPFQINAIVLLPDHLHAIWTLPRGDADYTTRWAWLKKEFTKGYLAAGGYEQFTSHSRKMNRRCGVWQRWFWEHTIEDEDDFEGHFDYIHYNPVKHGYVTRPFDWPYSSFHRWVRSGVYDSDWGSSGLIPRTISNVDSTFGE